MKNQTPADAMIHDPIINFSFFSVYYQQNTNKAANQLAWEIYNSQVRIWKEKVSLYTR